VSENQSYDDFNWNMSEIIEFPCTEKSLRRCRKDGLSTESINLRLVRVDLPTATTKILITSLIDEATFLTSIFADIYQQRWDVEEDCGLPTDS
jgi:hypothetical protein